MATEPSILSAFWIEYYCPPGYERERCICGAPECGVKIRDGRLVLVQPEGLTMYYCWIRLMTEAREKLEGRAGDSTPRTAAHPSPPGLRARIARWWKGR